MSYERIQVIDSHTGGEPTRVVVGGGPDLGHGPLSERARRFREQHDDLRRALVTEPRASEVVVGALLCEPTDPDCAAGVVFFNNVDVLGMCGHGTIGLLVTLAWLERIEPGTHRIETPVGVVEATLHDTNRVSVRNVRSHRHRAAVPLELPDGGTITGDIAWGGNWFFLCSDLGLDVDATNLDQLRARAKEIRRALERDGVTGEDGGLIDHIELFGPGSPACDSRSFVLCPGGEYDRSPCGTGTSAKLACLAADGLLPPGRTWRQESVIGSVFDASYEPHPDGGVIPTISGTAFVTGEARIVLSADDPFRFGIRP